MSETMVEHVAIAMRKAYSPHGGDSTLIPWEKSRACEEWLLCARAAMEVFGEVNEGALVAVAADISRRHYVNRVTDARAAVKAYLAALSQSHPQSPNTANTTSTGEAS
jgi:hypothetical protein